MLAPSQTTKRSRAETLLGLSDALSSLAKQMRTRESVARDFVRLVVRAERIASQAYLLNTSKWLFADNAKALASELAAFALSVAEAAARVKEETDRNAAIADALAVHAEQIAQVATMDGSVQVATLRAALQPLASTLTSLEDRIVRESAVVKHSDALANRASGLAEAARQLLEGGRGAGQAARSIHQAMRGFVGEAGLISKRMSGASAGLGDAAEKMALRTRELSGGRAPAVEPVDGVIWHSTAGA